MKNIRKSKTTNYAKTLRKYMTCEEKLLWSKLRAKRLINIKFKRQEVIGPFIVDFYCHKYKLVIELDGGQHNYESNIEYDKQRTKYLENKGLKVIRFWNNQIMKKNINNVLDQIIILGNLDK